MVTIGVDAHKRVHQALALDDAGSVLGSWRGSNSPDSWQCLLAWADSLPGPRQWGIEGAWNYGRGLAQFLVTQSETVYEVNPRWTAERRRHARKVGKSDRLDAHAVAKLVRDEATALPRILAEDTTAVLDLLVAEREAALAEATRLRNQLHQVLLQVDPDYQTHLPSLTSAAGVRAVAAYTCASSSVLQQQRVAAIRRFAQRLRLVLDQAAALKREICTLAETHYLPLTQLKGVQLLTAGALAGILGPGQRFTSEAQLAAYAGVAPLEASSAGIVRHRLNRGGNRRLNAILYRIALSQAHSWPPAQAYLARRKAEGKTWREAIRALKRYLVRAIWRLWQQCLTAQQLVTQAAERKEPIH
ncbi:MAG TPA: IS110 family transposase [Chloroflexota bacterium]|nr:IS110 family transposase [Chloroflexota bacterium]